jgi:putative ABC transport system permease protein
VTLLLDAEGIDPQTYPLAGELVLREPAGASAADVLKNSTDVLITRDIADGRGLHVGDSVLLSGDSTPIQLTVAGIVAATPSQRASSVFYSLETARLIENRSDVVNMVMANWGSAANADQIVIDSPYTVFVAVDRNGAVHGSNILVLFDMMLKGAGVLGLLVGGLSVSNTLQVMLARRRLEIAMLKTLGYRRPDLLALIGLETGIIGLAGGIVGGLLGILVAGKLIDMLAGSGSILLSWNANPVIVVGGVTAGVLTAVVFGMQAILASSATRPVQLLRDLPLKTPQREQAGRLGLFALMLLVFGVLVGIVLGAPLEGILYVFGGGIVIVLLRAVFWTVLWAMLRLPMPAFPMLRLARASLRERKTQASLVLLALFAGAFSVTFAALAIDNAQSVVTQLRATDAGYNLMIYTDVEGAPDALAQMVSQGAQEPYVTERIRGMVNGERIMLEGRDALDFGKDLQYSGDWSDDGNTALLPDYDADQYSVGDTLTLSVNGQEQTVTLAGFYTVDFSGMAVLPAPLIVSKRTLESFRGVPLQTRVIGKFPVEALSDAATTLGLTLPTALVFSRADLNDQAIAGFQSLFLFAASVAGLAFVAGAVLIANSAGLTVVERRREIGVFKAVGYTSGHVLRVLLSEYGFLGTLAGLFGSVGAAVAMLLLSVLQAGGRFIVDPAILAGMLLFSIGIAVLSAAVVAWQPTRVRPLDVLRYE